MSRILVLGGYGGFGARISYRLAGAGYDVIVAGRSLAKAQAFCRDNRRLVPLALDRNHGLRKALAEHRPAIVIDAAGPFQNADLAIPATCIAAGVHYLDIADARIFVTRISELDEAARAAGVVVISGASSVPALSGAAVRHLAVDIDDIRAVEIAISASNRATAGPSVAAAILSYVGKPFRLWRGKRWEIGYGWHGLRRWCFHINGLPPLNRLVGLADVPDLDLLPARLPGRPAVIFHAGAELSLQNIGLWSGGWLVRFGWLKSLLPLAPWLQTLHHLTARLGSDRSAMAVRLFGVKGDTRLERRWTVIAADGHGPEIPAIPAPLLAERILSGRLAPGARDAGVALSLADFEPAFAPLSIRHETRERHLPPSLYERVMGAAYHRLPPAVRRMHDVLRDGGAHGRATVTRGKHPLARIIARIVGFPPEGEHDVHVHFTERNGVETWTRSFSGRRFYSRLSAPDGILTERFGPLAFEFDLPSDHTDLTMVMRGWKLGPLPLPLFLAPRSEAREWEENSRFHFDVPIALPGIGLIVHYKGWLA